MIVHLNVLGSSMAHWVISKHNDANVVTMKATMGCFLLLQLTIPLPSENMNLLVDLLSEILPAQSSSIYP